MVGKNLIFIDSMQFINSSLEKWVQILAKIYLSITFKKFLESN